MAKVFARGIRDRDPMEGRRRVGAAIPSAGVKDTCVAGAGAATDARGAVPGACAVAKGAASACDGVRGWMARKAAHVESPLAVLQRGDPLVPARAPGVAAEARADGVVLARTERAQVVNQRVYFPLEDCDLRLLRDSPKRWR